SGAGKAGTSATWNAPSSLRIERISQHLERAYDSCAVSRDLCLVVLSVDELEEELALETEWLSVRDLRNLDVPRDGNAGGGDLLLVDRHLPLRLHVVEDHHLLAADDGHLPHLVRVEPGQVHVRDLLAREAEEAEDDVLDS